MFFEYYEMSEDKLETVNTELGVFKQTDQHKTNPKCSGSYVEISQYMPQFQSLISTNLIILFCKGSKVI